MIPLLLTLLAWLPGQFPYGDTPQALYEHASPLTAVPCPHGPVSILEGPAVFIFETVLDDGRHVVYVRPLDPGEGWVVVGRVFEDPWLRSFQFNDTQVRSVSVCPGMDLIRSMVSGPTA